MKRKGVVVEIAPKNRVIVMTPDGEFVKVPFKKDVHVGQEIRYVPGKGRLNLMKAGLVATFCLALWGAWPVLTGYFAVPKSTAAYVITMDVNPSLELRIDGQQQVLDAAGLNQDGRDLLARLSIVGDDLRRALLKIKAQMQREGYLGSEQSKIMVTIAAVQERGEEVRELIESDGGPYCHLQQLIKELFSTIQLAEVRVWQVTPALQNEAKLAGITPSRYLAIHLPGQFAIPRRSEVRLTMQDAFDVTKSAAVRVFNAQIGANKPRPPLMPVQWTKQNLALSGRSDIDQVNFPIVAEVKGDFQLH